MKTIEEYRQAGTDLYRSVSEDGPVYGIDEDGLEAKFSMERDGFSLHYYRGDKGLTPRMSDQYFLESVGLALAFRDEVVLPTYFVDEVGVLAGAFRLEVKAKQKHAKKSDIKKAEATFAQQFELFRQHASEDARTGVAS